MSNTINWQVLSVYLNTSLKVVKQQLGGVCKHLSFSKEKSLNKNTSEFEVYDAFTALMKNDLGGEDKVVYRINKGLHLLKKEDFDNLRFNLASRAYERQQEDKDTVPSV